jgi:hypothetical protein
MADRRCLFRHVSSSSSKDQRANAAPLQLGDASAKVVTMHIEYDITLDDLADACLRSTVRSKQAERARRHATFWCAVLTGTVLFMCFALCGTRIAWRFAFAGLGAAVVAGWYWLDYRRSCKRRLLRYLREQMQPDAPIRFVVELRDECIWTKQGGTQSSFGWDNVAEIVDSEDGVELHMRNGGFVFVKSREFPSEEAREEFKEIVNKKMHAVLIGPAGAAIQNA